MGPVEKLGSFDCMKLGTADTDGLKLGWRDGEVLIEGRSEGNNDGPWEMVGCIDGIMLWMSAVSKVG